MLNRKFEESSIDLSDKIISKSYTIKQRKPAGLYVKEYFFGYMNISKANFAYLSVAMFVCGIIMELSISQSVNVFDLMDNVYIGM